MLKYDSNIYLHFFDRELRNSINKNLRFGDKQAQHVIATALFMTELSLYVSFSHMYESKAEFPDAISMAFDYEKLGLLKMLTNMRNPDEFLSSRRSLYDFDKSRYLNYFSGISFNWPTDIFVVKDDTTSILRAKLLVSFEGSQRFPDILKESLQLSLVSNKRNAITYSFFKNTIQDNYNQGKLNDYQYQQAITDVRINISEQYTSRYLNVLDGTIITAIPGFYYYDILAKNEFLTNYSLYRVLLKPLFDYYNNNYIKILECRLRSNFKLLHNLLQRIILNINQITNNVALAKSIIEQYRLNSIRETIHSYDDYVANCIGLYDYVNSMVHKEGKEISMQTKVLLVVATRVELTVLLDKLSTISPVRESVGMISYFTTIIGDSLVYIVKCQMGQGGVGGSILTLEESIRLLNPDFVIMGGIALGADNTKQKIGDLLVSTKVWDYDPKRVNADGSLTPRGAISPSSPRLVQMFEVACVAITDFDIYYGLIASGSDLFDNEEYLELLKKEQPELIGGDMESAGMASVCSRKGINWILAKGICDWGYNKGSHKSEYQKTAATNSAEAIVSLLTKLSI